MIRQIVLLRWKGEVPPQRRAETIARMRALPAEVPQIMSYTVEENVGADPSNYDVVVIGEFADMGALEAYRDHPVHQELIREWTSPVLGERAGIQISG